MGGDGAGAGGSGGGRAAEPKLIRAGDIGEGSRVGAVSRNTSSTWLGIPRMRFLE